MAIEALGIKLLGYLLRALPTQCNPKWAVLTFHETGETTDEYAAIQLVDSGSTDATPRFVASGADLAGDAEYASIDISNLTVIAETVLHPSIPSAEEALKFFGDSVPEGYNIANVKIYDGAVNPEETVVAGQPVTIVLTLPLTAS